MKRLLFMLIAIMLFLAACTKEEGGMINPNGNKTPAPTASDAGSQMDPNGKPTN